MAKVMAAGEFAVLHPPEADQDWATWQVGLAWLLRRMALAHRDGARTLTEVDLALSLFLGAMDMAAHLLNNAGSATRALGSAGDCSMM
jgi:hypothetical protein